MNNTPLILAWTALALNLIFVVGSIRTYLEGRRYTKRAKELVDSIENEFFPKRLKLKIVKGAKNDSSDNIVS